MQVGVTSSLVVFKCLHIRCFLVGVPGGLFLTWDTNAKPTRKEKLIVEEQISFVAVWAVLDEFEPVAEWVVTEATHVVIW